jgi:ribosomal protein S18 acetylase RimI-like enzyme
MMSPSGRTTDPVIRPLTFEDLDDALRLSTAVGWNQTLDDWRMLLRLAPAGAFAAFVERRDVSDISDVSLGGTAIGIDYGAFTWIAMMLVDPAYRGRGLGQRLLQAAMDAVPSSLPIRLDATPLGRPLYQRYGFQDEATLSRHVIDDARLAEPRDARTEPAPFVVQPLTDPDLALVLEQDRETFGGTRAAVLEWAFRGAPQYAYVVRSNKSDRDPIQYCLGRQGRLFDQIGPVVAGDDAIAHALVNAALGAAGDRRVAVDSFDSRRAFAAALRADGFVVQRPLVRMFRPVASGACAPVDGQGNVCQFAILGPEFA